MPRAHWAASPADLATLARETLSHMAATAKVTAEVSSGCHTHSYALLLI